jgi:CubicO group peptidase (beta-lactamase class C family)
MGAPVTLVAQEKHIGELDRLFKSWNQPEMPGVGVAVIQHGKLVFEKGYGSATLEYDIPVKPGTVFHVASVSKQFTAMALLLLEQEGKLGIDDEVHKYLPELPDYGHPITLRQLLQHTSGIRDQWQTLAIAGWRLDDVITQKQILRLLFHQKELNFAPGTRHFYSNGGYTLAAEVVARVSGKSFPDFCQERIFAPLAMTHTHFHQDHRRIVRDRAYSYAKSEGGYEALPLNYANAGATSLFTTASDLARWLDNFRKPKLGGRAVMDRLQEAAVLVDGKKIDYGLGVTVGRYRGLRTISHGGADAGYRSYVVWFPEQELGVVVLSGLANFDPGAMANKVAAVYLGDKLSPETAKPEPPRQKPREYITLAAEALDPFIGHYKLEAGLEADIQKKNGKLMAEVPGQGTQELRPLATNRFFIEEIGGEVEFQSRPEGSMRLRFTQAGTAMNGERISTSPWEATHLEQFEGTYWSEELETQYTITFKTGRLIADHVHHGEIVLTPKGPDRFTTTEWFVPEVNFLRDATNRISGVTLGGGRVTAIRFIRKDPTPSASQRD